MASPIVAIGKERNKEYLRIKDENCNTGKGPAGWMKGLALGVPNLLWSCDSVAMEARYKCFKMTCHWDTYLTLYYNMDFSTLYAFPLLVSFPQVF